jgi:hypothetical protein
VHLHPAELKHDPAVAEDWSESAANKNEVSITPLITNQYHPFWKQLSPLHQVSIYEHTGGQYQVFFIKAEQPIYVE